METIKKHIISIVSGAVVLLALVAAWFITMPGAALMAITCYFIVRALI